MAKNENNEEDDSGADEIIEDDSRRNSIDDIFGDDAGSDDDAGGGDDTDTSGDDADSGSGDDDSVNEEVVTSDEEPEFDPDAPITKKGTKKEKPAGKKPADQSVKTMRKQLEVEGRQRKEAERKLAAFEAERKKEKEDLERELEESRASVPFDVNSLPVVKQFRDDVDSDAEVLLLVSHPAEMQEAFVNNAGKYISEYYAARKITDKTKRSETLAALRAKIGKTFDRDEDPEGNKATEVIFQFLREKATKLGEVHTEVGKLQAEAKTKRSVRTTSSPRYDDEFKAVSTLLEPLGAVDAEVLKSSPDSVEVFVHNLIKSDPEAAAKAKSLKTWIASVFAGEAPLTEAEKKKLEGQTDNPKIVQEVMDARKNKNAANRSAAARRQFLAGMALPQLPTVLKRLNFLEKFYKEHVSTENALDDIDVGDDAGDSAAADDDDEIGESASVKLSKEIFR